MKKQLLPFLFAIVASVGTMFAEKVQIGDLYYNLNEEDKTAEVTYKSYANYSYNKGWNITTADIPASVTYSGTTYSVTSIGKYAFRACFSLTSVTIPNSVTSIGGDAFSGCSGLTSVEIPNNVTNIGSGTFAFCIGLTSVTIPNSVTSIGIEAFLGCSSLTSVTIPNSVTSIGSNAFNNCSSLTSVTIPNSVTSIGQYAFCDCSGLTSVTIPNSVTSIGESAFYGCSSLTSVTLNSNTIVGKDYEYYNIKSIFGEQVTEYILGDEITSIGESAFYECTGLTSVTIPNSVTSIGFGAFYNCRSLTKVNITDIAAWCNIAFTDSYSNPLYYAKHLFVNDVEVTDLVIPNSVTSIGESAFYGCTGLTSVTIPNSVTSIGYQAFRGCSSLTSVTIPNSVTSIGSGAFENCSSLPVVDNLRYADTYLVEAVNKTLSSYTIKNGTRWIGSSAFSGCSSLTSVTIPNSVTSIGYQAFYDCSSLTSVTIPNSVTRIGDGAFRGCSSLTSVTIPDSVTSIGYEAFRDCGSLTSVTIPNSVTSIGNSAFSGCGSLTSVTIPNSVTSIGYQAFYDCSSLTSVTIPNSVTSIGIEAFNGCSSLTAIYVPCGEMERFKQMLNNDSRINDHAPLPYTITINAINGNVAYPQTICDDMLLNATPDYGYHFVKWSDGNTDNPRTIELRQDTTLEAIFAVDKYGTCGDNLQLTWRYDTGSQTLTISGEGDLTTNMRYGVEAVKEMRELVIEDGVGVIGNEAFANIKTLNTITLGKDVRKLQERVFYNCYNLTAIYNYRKTPASATSNTFEEVDKYACTIYVMAGSEDMFRSATGWKDFYSILAIGATETTVTDNKATVKPSDNSATVTWPVSNDAVSYTIDITKDGVVFCRLTFNANGQLTGIAFAPGRDGQSMAPAALMTTNGLQFTVTGLSSNTQYGYSITATDAENTEVASYTGTFTTTGEIATAIDAQQSDIAPFKFIRDNQVLILRDGKTYTVQGQQLQ